VLASVHGHARVVGARVLVITGEFSNARTDLVDAGVFRRARVTVIARSPERLVAAATRAVADVGCAIVVVTAAVRLAVAFSLCTEVRVGTVVFVVAGNAQVVMGASRLGVARVFGAFVAVIAIQHRSGLALALLAEVIDCAIYAVFAFSLVRSVLAAFPCHTGIVRARVRVVAYLVISGVLAGKDRVAVFCCAVVIIRTVENRAGSNLAKPEGRFLGFFGAYESAVADVTVIQGVAVVVQGADALLDYQFVKRQEFTDALAITALVWSGTGVSVVTIVFVVGVGAGVVDASVIGARIVVVTAVRTSGRRILVVDVEIWRNSLCIGHYFQHIEGHRPVRPRQFIEGLDVHDVDVGCVGHRVPQLTRQVWSLHVATPGRVSHSIGHSLAAVAAGIRASRLPWGRLAHAGHQKK